MIKKICLFITIFCAVGVFNPVYAIKIGLYTNVESVRLGSSTNATIINGQTHKTIYTLDSR